MSAMQRAPDGYRVVTPYFTVPNADWFIAFVSEVFGGELTVENRYENNTVQHARMRIGDTIIMLNEANDDYSPTTSQMYVFVTDVEATFAKALSAGASATMEPYLRHYGDWVAGVKDPCGNIWWIASPS